MSSYDVSEEHLTRVYERIEKDAQSAGYNLNPDRDFARDLVRGLLINENRYGYQACPCRLSSGEKSKDLDIICPCDYRDSDLNEYNMCYCALYVSAEVINGTVKLEGSIPDRKPANAANASEKSAFFDKSALPLPVWRCRVCGYLCGREDAPSVCPICKARKERFERFI